MIGYVGLVNIFISMVSKLFTQTCRTCLSTSGDMVSIFSTGSHVNQLPKKLMAFTKVEISVSDALPKMICKKCMFMADAFYCFKEQCEAADNQLKLMIKRNSDDVRNGNGLTLVDDLNNIILRVKKSENEVREIAERSRETEKYYNVEYISEEVRIEVENASKRRLETERKISMEKVSESIKNLKGIEVVPISDVSSTSNELNSKYRKEEIAVFPVKVPKKKCKIIEAIVIDDPLALNKKLRLSPESMIFEVNGTDAETEDSVVYEKHTKLNVSAVKRVVKIDDEELSVEPKKENIIKLNRENPGIKYDTDVVLLINDNDKEIYNKNPDINTLRDKLQGELKDEKKILKTQPARFSDVISADDQNMNSNENNTTQIDSIEGNAAENGEPYNYYPSTTQRPGVIDNISTHDIVTESTIRCIMTEIEGQNFGNINLDNDGEDLIISKNAKYDFKNFVDYKTNKTNGAFVEQNKINENSKLNMVSIVTDERQISGDSSNFYAEITPLASLSVDPSGEENGKINLNIDACNDSKKLGETSFVKYESPNDFSHQNVNSSNIRFYECTICSINFVSMPAVLKHNIQEHMPDHSPFICLVCDKSFPDKSLLGKHVDEHSDSRPYKCTFCPKTFTLKRNQKRHVNHHINYKPFQCRICMKRFTEKSSLKSHMYLHTENSPFACKSCNVSFNNKTNWRRHVMTIHEKLISVMCKFCNKELPNRRSLRVHTRIHTGDKPYQCPHCNKSFTQQCNLNTHIHCHLNDRPFSCPYCGKGFNQRGTRDDHILTHTGEKPHKCTECAASFTVSSALKRHMWIHTKKDRPYNCKECKLQFIGLYDWRRHLKNKHGKVVKPGNPRVERVSSVDQNKDAVSSEIRGESEPNLTEVETFSGVVGCSKTKITAKENSSLSCNM